MIWTKHSEGPQIIRPAAVCVGDLIYYFGRPNIYDLIISGNFMDVCIFDPVTLESSELHYELPSQLLSFTAVAYKNLIYLWGSTCTDFMIQEILLCFNISTQEWTLPDTCGHVPPAKNGHSACIIKNKMYIFGGREYAGWRCSNDVHHLNLDTMEWSLAETQGELPSPRESHTTVSANDRIYVFGGRSPTADDTRLVGDYNTDLYFLDTNTQTWVNSMASGNAPCGRRDHSAWVHNGYIYVFGGYNHEHLSHFNDLHRYSVCGNNWERLTVPGQAPPARRCHTSTVYNNTVIISGGCGYQCDELKSILNIEVFGDLHILNYLPSLMEMCMVSIVDHGLDQSVLPNCIVKEIETLILSNTTRSEGFINNKNIQNFTVS